MYLQSRSVSPSPTPPGRSCKCRPWRKPESGSCSCFRPGPRGPCSGVSQPACLEGRPPRLCHYGNTFIAAHAGLIPDTSKRSFEKDRSTCWTWRPGRGRRCSMCHFSSPGCSCFSGLGGRWQVCPACRRSLCVGGRGRRPPSMLAAAASACPAWWTSGSQTASRSHGSRWWGRAAWRRPSLWCPPRWSLRR